MKTKDDLRIAVEQALKATKHRLMHPEEHDHYGKRIYLASRFGEPLKARQRLSVRLSLVCALREYESALLKEILADRESIEGEGLGRAAGPAAAHRPRGRQAPAAHGVLAERGTGEISISDAARRARVSRQAILGAIRRGTLAAKRIVVGSVYSVDVQSLRVYAEGRRGVRAGTRGPIR